MNMHQNWLMPSMHGHPGDKYTYCFDYKICNINVINTYQDLLSGHHSNSQCQCWLKYYTATETLACTNKSKYVLNLFNFLSMMKPYFLYNQLMCNASCSRQSSKRCPTARFATPRHTYWAWRKHGRRVQFIVTWDYVMSDMVMLATMGIGFTITLFSPYIDSPARSWYFQLKCIFLLKKQSN